MVKTGRCNLRRKIGEVGISGEVSVSLLLQEDAIPCSGVTFDGSVSERWRLAVEFGVAYALERVSEADRDRISEVQITEVNAHAIDSTSIVVAYVACLAVLNALADTWTSSPPRLDETTCSFCFPK